MPIEFSARLQNDSLQGFDAVGLLRSLKSLLKHELRAYFDSSDWLYFTACVVLKRVFLTQAISDYSRLIEYCASEMRASSEGGDSSSVNQTQFRVFALHLRRRQSKDPAIQEQLDMMSEQMFSEVAEGSLEERGKVFLATKAMSKLFARKAATYEA